MIIDTNVLSESSKPRPDRAVEAWFTTNRGRDLFTTATVVGEASAGIAILPPGRRRIELQDGLDLQLATRYAGHVLPFDLEAGLVYGMVQELRRTQGRPIHIGDAQIAAVCLLHEATLVTRNTRDFAGLGLKLVNPWTEG